MSPDDIEKMNGDQSHSQGLGLIRPSIVLVMPVSTLAGPLYIVPAGVSCDSMKSVRTVVRMASRRREVAMLRPNFISSFCQPALNEAAFPGG